MSIPKVIHYCWFGGSEMPAAYKKYMESWKRYCPDYEIKLWNEQNFDFSDNLYARQAYEQKKWAFVSDYARLKIIYEFGGIYLDTDVEILRPLDDLLELKGFLGFQDNKEIATGLGFGAEKGNPVIKAMLADYADAAFILPDGTHDTTPCPERNTEALIPLGFRADGCMQTVDGVTLFPADYFCPIGFLDSRKNFSANTYSIHHYAASWKSAKDRLNTNARRRVQILLGNGSVYNKLFLPTYYRVLHFFGNVIRLCKKILHK